MIQLDLLKIAGLSLAIIGYTFSSSSGQVSGDLEQLRGQALELVNRARQDHGLKPLSQGSVLNKAAQAHAEDMLNRGYYAHVSPEGDTVMDRFVAAGGSRWQLTAENIARGQGCPSPPTSERVQSLHQGWMNSPPHRENILRRGVERFGFGVIVGPDQTLYAVQTFAGPGTSRGSQPDERPEVLDPRQQTDVALQSINKARRGSDLPLLKPDGALVQAAETLIPNDEPTSSELNLQGNLATVVPDESGSSWRSLSLLVGRCGGCGANPTAADVRSFVQQWLDNPSYKEQLLSPELTHLGLIVRAYGSGQKIGAVVLGQR